MGIAQVVLEQIAPHAIPLGITPRRSYPGELYTIPIIVTRRALDTKFNNVNWTTDEQTEPALYHPWVMDSVTKTSRQRLATVLFAMQKAHGNRLLLMGKDLLGHRTKPSEDEARAILERTMDWFSTVVVDGKRTFAAGEPVVLAFVTIKAPGIEGAKELQEITDWVRRHESTVAKQLDDWELRRN
jgi:hypothetical protein